MKKRKQRKHGLGTIFEYRPGYWLIRWREGGKRHSAFGFHSQGAAEAELNKIRVRLDEGRPGAAGGVYTGAPSLGVLFPPFLERRKLDHAVWREDGYRWKKHLEPFFGAYKPSQVTAAVIRAYVEGKLAQGVAPATLRVHVALLSSCYEDLKERAQVELNPCRGLPKSLLKLMRPKLKPEEAPFLESVEAVRRVFLALPEPLHVAFLIGALTGARTGEVFALKWVNVNLETRRIFVRESARGPTKNRQARTVPIQASLLEVLKAWKLKTGGEGLVVPPLRIDGRKMDKHTPGIYLRKALAETGLAREGLTWYACTRVTFASLYMLHGGEIGKLSKLLGHSSIAITERHYVRLRTSLFSEEDLNRFQLDLRPAAGTVLRLETTKNTHPGGPNGSCNGS